MKSQKQITLWKKKLLPFAAALLLAGVRTARADYASTIIADHPVAFYRLAEPSGSATVADSSGNGFTGTVDYETQADAITVYPQLGQAGVDSNSVAFATSTGVTQGNIDVPFAALMNQTTDGTDGAPFSAEIWVQAVKQPSGYAVPLDDSCNFSQPPPWNNSAGWNFYQTPGPASTWAFSIRPAGLVGGGPAVTLGVWTHLVLTYNGTTTILYVNGVASITAGGLLYYANPGTGPESDLLMGFGPNTGQIAFDGNIADVAVYTNALTALQVSTHYTVGTNEISVAPTAPSFSSEPVASTTYSGVPVTFTSQAIGTAPLSYQWVKQGSGPILNATNNNYTFTPIYPADDGDNFYVTVTNFVGSTNSPLASLTVETNLNINNSPFSITRRVGGYAAFRVAADGALPITYQWHVISNSVDQIIAGATSDTVWLSNVTAAASGNLYYAAVTGPFGAAPSDQASLTVVPRPASSLPVTAYSQIVTADSPVAYWRLDESTGSTNALDSVGSFDGAYSSLGTDLTFGYPTGIPSDIDTGIHVTNSATVTIPYALELNPVTGPWSYEIWIQPTSQDSANFHTPLSSLASENAGANKNGWNIYQHPSSYWTWNIFNGFPPGSFSSEFVDHPVVPGTWYHMVLTDDGTNMTWYVNNRLVLTVSVSSVGFIQNGVNGDPTVNAGPTTIGIRSDGVFGDWDGGAEDLAVYNYILSPQQIQNHFLNTTHVTAVRSGSNVIFTWPAGILESATVVAGPYTPVIGATSPYSVPASSLGHVFYRVKLQ